MRDFTPTPGPEKNTGGAKNFISFIEKELIPFIDSSYSTAPNRTILGHSLGGLLATELLEHYRDIFNSYIIVDAAVWWDEMSLIRSMKLKPDESKNKNKVYLAIANSLPTTVKDTTEALSDTTYGTGGYRSKIKLRETLQNISPSPINLKSKYYPTEHHGSIPLIGYHDGLKFVFDYFK